MSCSFCKWNDGGKYFEDANGNKTYKVYCRYHHGYYDEFYDCGMKPDEECTFDNNDTEEEVDIPKGRTSLPHSKHSGVSLWGIVIIATIFLIYGIVKRTFDFEVTDTIKYTVGIIGSLIIILYFKIKYS